MTADERGRLITALKRAQQVLDDVRGDINPERGYAEDLEKDVVDALAVIAAALES